MYRRIPLSYEVKNVLQLLLYTLAALLVVISGYFFVKTSNTAEKGYSVREAQLHQKQLESEQRILKQQLLEAQSITVLQNNDVVRNMVPPLMTKYIEPRGPLSKNKSKSKKVY